MTTGSACTTEPLFTGARTSSLSNSSRSLSEILTELVTMLSVEVKTDDTAGELMIDAVDWFVLDVRKLTEDLLQNGLVSIDLKES